MEEPISNLYFPCIIIPTYNHGTRLVKTLANLIHFEMPIIIIDDGSTDNTSELLKNFTQELVTITYHKLNYNQGKGVAVTEGFKIALAQGKTHTLQIDADGQHDVSAIKKLIELSKVHPAALIIGKPVFQSDIPLVRLYGRELTNFLFALESRRFKHYDVLCGFRCYPLNKFRALLTSGKNGNRMDFDLIVAVNLSRSGCQFIQTPVNISYPLDNTSNFKYLRDNLILIKSHLKLLWSALYCHE